MAVIRLRANAFSFKPNNNLWPCEIDIDFDENNCIVLTGINAGGKSLTLRALQKFSDLLCTPNFDNLNKFVTFSKLVDIEYISAEYRFDWPMDTEDTHHFSMDKETCIFALEKLNPGENFDEWNLDWVQDAIQIIIQTRFSPKDGFERRIGCWYRITYNLVKLDEEQETWGRSHEDTFWHDWEKIFITKDVLQDKGYKTFREIYDSYFFTNASIAWNKLSDIEMYQMEHFGPLDFEDQIKQKFGPEYSWREDFANEGSEKINFVSSGVKLIDVDSLYEIGTDREEILREFHNKTVRKTKDDARKYINDRLNKVFDKHKQFWEDRHYRIYSKSFKKSNNESPIEAKQWCSSPENKYAFAREIHPQLIESFERCHGHSEKLYADYFRYPGDEIDEIHGADTHHYREEFLDYLSFVENPGPLKVNSKLRNYAHMFTAGEVPEFEFDDDITGWLREVTFFYLKILIQHDPEFAYICLSYAFLDYPDMNSAPSYYSSGQRRMLSMISNILSTRPETVIFIDEPEISLHIDWQRQFITKTGFIKRNLLIATHSPDIIYNHPDKVVEVPPSKEV